MINDISNGWLWIGFSIFLVIALSVDTFLLGKNHARSQGSMRAALIWTCIWVALALIFNGILWSYLYLTTDLHYANQKALDFFAGYLIEKSLSIDNLFAFYMVFSQLKIPLMYQQRIFSYGIWSAIIMRLLLILLGTWVVAHFHWVLYIMGAFLLLTGIKMFFTEEKEKDIADNTLIKIIKSYFRVTPDIEGNKFFVKRNALYYATPLFIALVFIEISDLIFAFDSIPAIFAITQDPFIVWTSNIFAILGLRALYFLLAGMIQRFHLLKYGIAMILVFVGSKMVIEPWFSISVEFSLAVIIGILLIFSWVSMVHQQQKGK